LAINSFMDFDVKVKSNLGVMFIDNLNNRTINILKSGIMIVDNINSKEEAYGFYKKIMVDWLGVNVRDI
ncbi:MAG: hypothetical protein QXE19_05250, partial [Candidatus Bathyarchaeia archaeon]